MPSVFAVNLIYTIHIELEYLQKGVFWESTDGHR
jgi:hypothetical protein